MANQPLFRQECLASGGSKTASAEMAAVHKKGRMTAFLVHCVIIHKADV